MLTVGSANARMAGDRLDMPSAEAGWAGAESVAGARSGVLAARSAAGSSMCSTGARPTSAIRKSGDLGLQYGDPLLLLQLFVCPI
jgi:hypothetical protein